jgi:hypothetical protein
MRRIYRKIRDYMTRQSLCLHTPPRFFLSVCLPYSCCLVVLLPPYSYLVAVYLPFLPPGRHSPSYDRQPASQPASYHDDDTEQKEEPFSRHVGGLYRWRHRGDLRLADGVHQGRLSAAAAAAACCCLLSVTGLCAIAPSLVHTQLTDTCAFHATQPTHDVRTKPQNNNTDRHNCNSSPKPKARSCPTLAWCQA